MKKRIFYVINLDRGRIMTLLILFGAFISISFISGFHMGKTSSGMPLYSADGEVSYLNEKNYGIPMDHSQPSQSLLSGNGESLTRISGMEEPEKNKPAQKEPAAEKKSSSKPAARPAPKPVPKVKKEPVTIKTASKKPSPPPVKKTSTAPTAKSKSEISRTTAQPQKSPEQNPRSPLLGADNIKLSGADAASSSAASNNVKYSLQIGAFNNNETAQRMKNQLSNEGFNAYVVSHGSHYKVRVGKSMDTKALESMETRLKSKKFASYRIKE